MQRVSNFVLISESVEKMEAAFITSTQPVRLLWFPAARSRLLAPGTRNLFSLVGFKRRQSAGSRSTNLETSRLLLLTWWVRWRGVVLGLDLHDSGAVLEEKVPPSRGEVHRKSWVCVLVVCAGFRGKGGGGGLCCGPLSLCRRPQDVQTGISSHVQGPFNTNYTDTIL